MFIVQLQKSVIYLARIMVTHCFTIKLNDIKAIISILLKIYAKFNSYFPNVDEFRQNFNTKSITPAL